MTDDERRAYNAAQKRRARAARRGSFDTVENPPERGHDADTGADIARTIADAIADTVRDQLSSFNPNRAAVRGGGDDRRESVAAAADRAMSADNADTADADASARTPRTGTAGRGTTAGIPDPVERCVDCGLLLYDCACPELATDADVDEAVALIVGRLDAIAETFGRRLAELEAKAPSFVRLIDEAVDRVIAGLMAAVLAAVAELDAEPSPNGAGPYENGRPVVDVELPAE